MIKTTYAKCCTLLFTSLLASLGSTPGLVPYAYAAQAAGLQGGTASKPSSNLLGTITAATADSLTLKLESGSEATISIAAETRLLRTAPGEKTLKGATPIHLEDLAIGDRVLVLRVTPSAEPAHYSAAAVVAMKQADIAQVHAMQSEDWQRRGMGGIVQSVQAAPAGTDANATITVGGAQPGRSLSIHVSPSTTIRRYAADSVSFADAKSATLADIHPGDQLRARGDRNAEGTEVTAVEIVAGSFRNVAGTITALDAAQSTVTVTDLATKKPVTLKMTSETQMRKLPAEMAQRLAARGGQGTAGKPGGDGPARVSGEAPNRPMAGGGPGMDAKAARPTDTPEASPEPGGGPNPAGQTRGRGDTSSMLQHAPPVTLAELKKGDAIMVVASRDGGATASTPANAISLIAGVEPLLESSSGSASQNLFSASWNLSGGGAEAP